MFPLDDVDDDTADSLASLPASPGGAHPPPRPRAAAVAPCPATLKPAPPATRWAPPSRAVPLPPRDGREKAGDPPKAASAPCAPTYAPVGDECCVCLEPFDDDPATLTRCE